MRLKQTVIIGLCNIPALQMSCVNIYSVHVVLMADSVQLLLSRLLCVDSFVFRRFSNIS